jgi:NAD(P)H-dependent FMN reductase
MPLFIPVIEGTARKDRKSIHVANLITDIGKEIDGIETQLIDPPEFDLPYDGNDENAKDPKYTEITARADAFFLVIPEYNHSFPGTLKRILDSELKNYVHKPVAFAGVSAGPWGGIRAIQSMVPVVREMGMVATFTDVQFPSVQKLFDENGKLLDEKYIERVKKSFTELIWMAEVLQWGRENVKSVHHEKV